MTKWYLMKTLTLNWSSQSICRTLWYDGGRIAGSWVLTISITNKLKYNGRRFLHLLKHFVTASELNYAKAARRCSWYVIVKLVAKARFVTVDVSISTWCATPLIPLVHLYPHVSPNAVSNFSRRYRLQLQFYLLPCVFELLSSDFILQNSG